MPQESLYDPPAVAGVTIPGTVTHYDLDRQVDDLVLLDQTVLDLVYDTAGRLDAVVVPGRGTIDWAYSPLTGQLASTTTPEGSPNSLTFGYEGSLRESEIWSGEVAGSVTRSHDDELLVVWLPTVFQRALAGSRP